MDTSLLATKVFVPTVRPELVARPRLTGRLKDASNYRMILVSAPAGFGKTTILTQWVSENKLPGSVAWVSLDEGDSDPVRFWDYVIAALKTLQPSIGDNALAMLHSTQVYPFESVLTVLINDLAKVGHNFALVLDDYHSVKTEAVHKGIAFLLDHLPPRMSLIVATRSDPPLPLSLLRGRGLLLEIVANELRFTSEEASSLLKSLQQHELTDEDVDVLNDRTEGWAVGLKMAALSLHAQKQARLFLRSFGGSHRYVMDYLIEEILNHQSQETRDFLLKTSVLERLSAPLCDYIMDRSGSQEILISLESSFQGFLVALDDSRNWYRYHHLLTDVLRHQLEKTVEKEQVSVLNQRASIWCEQNSYFDEGIQYALVSRNWERAVSMIAITSEERIKQGENLTLLGWIEKIPEEILRGNIPLYTQYARVLLVAGTLAAAEAALTYLERTTQDGKGIQGEVAALQVDLARRKGDGLLVIDTARKALSLLPPESMDYRVRTSYVLGVALCDIGSFDEAWSLLQDAYVMSRDRGNALLAANSLAYQAIILAKQGKLRDAFALSRRSADIAGQSPAAALALEELGIICYEWNDLEGAYLNLRLGAEAAELTGSDSVKLGCYIWLALTKLAQGDVTGARAMVEKSESSSYPGTLRPGARAWQSAWRMKVALRQDDLPTASYYHASLKEYLGVLPFSYQHIPVRMLIASGEKAPAAEQLEHSYKEAVNANALGLVIEIRVYQALAATTEIEALTFLADALEMAQSEGFIRTFVDEGRLLKPLLHQALSRGITPEYTIKLVSAIETGERLFRTSAGTASALPGPSEFLSQRELQVLRLVADGLSNKQISERLTVSLNTAKTHVYRVFNKLNAKDRLQAVTRARELKLI
jgi:LuxR family transcriptional regulator, maltose regulon positive regulatory protein